MCDRLRPLLEQPRREDGAKLSEELVEALFEEREIARQITNSLMPDLLEHICGYDCEIQCGILGALVNLSIYEESIFDAVAQQHSGPGPLRCPPEQAGKFAVSLAVCFSDAGHYDERLCENLVQQGVASMHQMSDPSSVVLLLAAMEELCHYSPDLLQAAGPALVKDLSPLTSYELIQTLHCYAFFGASNPPFYQRVLDTLAAMPLDATCQSAGRLARGLMLMPDESVRLPPGLVELLENAQDSCGPDSLGPRACPCASVEQLQEAAASQEALQHLATYGMLTAHEVLLALASLPDVAVNNMQQRQGGQADEGGGGGPNAGGGRAEAGGWDDVSPSAFLPVSIQPHNQGTPRECGSAANEAAVAVCIALSADPRTCPTPSPAAAVGASQARYRGAPVAVRLWDEVAVCSNAPDRLRGSAQAEVMGLSLCGWAVASLHQEEWIDAAGEDDEGERRVEMLRRALEEAVAQR
ncbi:MAG: hypothetical protein WDW38_010266 [Sanguina aurantia]